MESGFTVSILSAIELLKAKKIRTKAKRERIKKGKRGDSEAKEERRSSPRFVLSWRSEAM